MMMPTTLIAAVAAAAAGAPGPDASAPALRFRAHAIDAFPGGYQVSVADMNGDGWPDVVALAERPSALAWYEAPSWKKHPVDLPGIPGFIDVAPRDIDGDGRADLALATDFALANSQTGRVHWLERPPGGESWRLHPIATSPSSHRLRWADLDGDGRAELVDVPLLGPGARQPDYAVPARLAYYRVPARPAQDPWPRQIIDETLTVIHGVRVVDWDRDRADELLVASFEGVHLFDRRAADGSWEKKRLAPGAEPGADLKRGASEVALCRLGDGRRALATIEPWHGHTVAVYLPDRRVVDDTLADGHALGCADFDGDGRDEIVAGFRGKGRSLRLYRARDAGGASWERVVLDDGGMGAAGLFVADLNRDGRLDLVATGTPTANVKWYENLGAPDPSEAATLLILQKAASTLGFYAGDGRPLAAVPVGKHPHEMLLAPDGRTLYVTDNGTMRMEHPGEGGNTISIVDVAARRKLGEISLGKFRRPHGIDLDPRTGRLVVTAENPDRILVVDPTARSVLADLDAGGAKPHMVIYGPRAATALASNSASNSVGIVDVAGKSATAAVTVGAWPQGTVLAPDGRELYVTTRQGVSVVDLRRRKEVGRISAGQNTNRIALAPDGRTLVYAAGAGVELADRRSRKVLARVPLAHPVVSLTLSPDGARAFASAEDQDTVFVVSVRERRLLRTLKLPAGSGPDPVLELPAPAAR